MALFLNSVYWIIGFLSKYSIKIFLKCLYFLTSAFISAKFSYFSFILFVLKSECPQSK